MAQLDPTRKRLSLLRAVADGFIWRDADERNGTKMSARIDVRMDELCDAGWVELGHATDGQRRRWDVTDAGRAVLEEAQ